MDIKENLNTRLFKDFSANEWDELLGTFDGTINYTAWFINYIEVLNAGFNIKNLTFGLFKGNEVIAIVPLYVEEVDSKWQMSMGQEPIYAPIINKNAPYDAFSEYYKYIVDEIERVASQYHCVLARFHYSPLLYTKNSHNYFTEFEYSEDILHPDWYIFKSMSSYVINLSNNRDLLIKQIRKGHRANISRTSKLAKLIILDKESYNQGLFDRYVELYYQIKGLMRTLDVFELDSIAIRFGLEAIMLCDYKGKLVGAVALHTYNKKARYNSSVQLYDIDEGIYPNHFLLGAAIDYLKENGFELFEVGEQVTSSDLYQLSDKEKNLSHFKAGWGGDLTPCMKAQKEFNNV
jgi:hypothetical protein